MHWRGRITYREPPFGFVDELVRGSCRLWRYDRRFCAGGGGTATEDGVRYRLPFAPFDDFRHPLVRLRLERIIGGGRSELEDRGRACAVKKKM